MKNIVLFIFLLLSANFLNAQAKAGYVENKKVQQSAAVLELPFEEDLVMAALNDHLSKKGKSKSTDIKGFTTFRNNQVMEAGTISADMYFKVDRKSRKEKNITVISLLVGPGQPVPEGDQTSFMDMDASIYFLNGLVPVIEAYVLEEQIKDQNEVVKKSESKHSNLIKEGEDLAKKKAEIEKKIQENANKIQAQAADIENQKQILSEKVSRRS
jgi:hypothetical protein